MTRNIEDILQFRSDLSPFLIHLTRSRVEGDFFQERTVSATKILEKIIAERKLEWKDDGFLSAAKYGISERDYNSVDKKFFGATCFTETPLNEVHCLLDIPGRQVNLDPFGLVFLKKKLTPKGVAPAIYLNNTKGDKDQIVRALCALIKSNAVVAKEVLPLITFFGKKLIRPGEAEESTPVGEMDFYWEREWRLPSCKSPLCFDETDVFLGLCQHEEIGKFEGLFDSVRFIDPRRPVKWYASKIIAAQEEKANFKFSL